MASNQKISIFDQGMVQFVSSLALFSDITDRERVSRAFKLLPKPGLLVRLRAPRRILEVRLRERRRTLGIIQKFLDLDLQSSLDQIHHINLVGEELKSFPVIKSAWKVGFRWPKSRHPSNNALINKFARRGRYPNGLGTNEERSPTRARRCGLERARQTIYSAHLLLAIGAKMVSGTISMARCLKAA
ncbi:hypothetical protein Mesau_02773 [Mesorhizobium australicum WSM2073]|uniref:Uncharacterized protein n=1 Tax=Mesorhizobium australicum (strain HAMBI 3006 / LMG 24608 / WSM2073) TaxID=754035 RepID=L0KME1_MESAW|nr:hypothetical protein Mesau_02773 [Mesorhizobium australicum WSM2073]